MEQHTLPFIPPNKYPSECQITIYRQSGIVVATDTDTGISVTNACEIIATEVVRQFGVSPHRMIFIEQYRPGRPDQTTDLVQFDIVADERKKRIQFRQPRWIHLSATEFETMIRIAEEVEAI
jgi:hypothetical protein